MSGDSTDLPKGWSRATIDELLQPLGDGRTLHHGWSPQCEQDPSMSGEWGVLKTTAIQPGAFLPEHNKRLPKELAPRPSLEVVGGDLLLTCAGPRARCGVPCLVRQTRPKLLISGKMYRFRVPPGLIDARYTEAALLTPAAQAAIDKMKTGISDSGLNLTHDRFRQLEILVAPFAEQSRIVAEIEKQLSRIDAAVAALRRVQANLKAYRAAVLEAACSGRLVPTEAELARSERRTYEHASKLLERILAERRARWNGRGKYKEPAPPDPAGLATPPEGWAWCSLDQVGTVVRGASPRPAGDPRFFGGTIPWITVGPLTADESPYLRSVPQTVTEAGREASRFIEPGTLLLTNSGATLGVPKITLIGGCINDGVAAILDAPPDLKLYLHYFLSTQTERLRGINQGAAQPNLNTTIIKALPVPLPPEAEVARIVPEIDRRLSVVQELDAEIATNLLRADRLRQSVLKRAFEGKLVPQDPNDEPASVLLDRIRAARDGQRTTASPSNSRRPRKVPTA